MKNINKIKIAVASVLISVSLSSCSDWLKVEMEDKIMETTLFSKYTGYVAALNGVYIGLNDYYTANLTMSVIDVMAQYYDMGDTDNHTFNIYSKYNYGDIDFEKTNSNLWNKGYELIANNNVILSHLENEGSTPLTHEQFCLLRGEALAMRAMLHFDILRRHGSIYSQNPDAEAIPYQTDTKHDILPMLPHRVVMEKIFADLNEAVSLLKDVDPIITEGTKNIATEDNGVSNYDMAFRQLRLNYYAVQGLLARAYLWVGDRANAYRVAKNEIIDKITTNKLTVFPWTTKGQVEADKKQDYLFSSEIIYGLYNSRRSNLYTGIFASGVQLSTRLTFYGQTAGDSKVALFYDNDNDFRKQQWELIEPTQADIDAAESAGTEVRTSYFCKKYQDFESGFLAGVDTYRYMVSMIRLSEIYLIAAETTDNPQEAYEYINAIRIHRQCPDLDVSANFDRDLTYEFAREVLGEGQLFYFYKRRAETRIIDKYGAVEYEMDLSNYVWPIPEAELSKRTEISK